MDTKILDLFVSVARRGSFSAAAKELNADPSSVSRAIGDLERELGVRLFQRTTRSMTLTEAGHLYLSRVEPVSDELVRAREAALGLSRRPRGTLRLTASVTFGQTQLVPLLADFRRLYPDLAVECVFTDANLDLVAERIDLAVRLGPLVEGDLIAAKLMDTRYRVVASPSYLTAHPAIAKPSDLTEHRVLRFNLRAFRSRWLFRDADGAEESVSIDGDVTLTPAGSLLDAAKFGLGPALLPHWLVDEAIREGKLCDLFPQLQATATSFDTAAWLVYPSRAYLPEKVRAMADFLRQRFRAGGDAGATRI
jgi:DNA-binding transcriptional LysR family regulator